MITAYFPKDRLCFGKNASLDFHQARNGSIYGPHGPPFPEITRWMVSQYPQDIRLWIKAKGDAEKMPLHGFWTLTAHELWEMGYQKCAA